MKNMTNRLAVICGALVIACFAVTGCSKGLEGREAPVADGTENVAVTDDTAVVENSNDGADVGNDVINESGKADGDAVLKIPAKVSDRERYLRTIVDVANSDVMMQALYDDYSGAICEYSFFDFTCDGENDLIVKYGTSEADLMYDFYTMIDGRSVKVGEFGAGHSALVSDGRDLIIHMGMQGYEEAHRVTYSDGKAEFEPIFDRYMGYSDYYEFPLYLTTFYADNLSVPDYSGLSHTFAGHTGLGNLYCSDFTVNLPESWANKYVCEYVEWDLYYEMHFYECDSFEYGDFGGELFSLRLMSEGSGYDENSPECVAKLTKYYDNGDGDKGSYSEYIVVDYPDVVNYMAEAAQNYIAMQKDIGDILKNITYADGVEVKVLIK